MAINKGRLIMKGIKIRLTYTALLFLGLFAAGCEYFTGPEAGTGNVTVQLGPGSGALASGALASSALTSGEARGVDQSLIPSLSYRLEFRGPGGEYIPRIVPPGTEFVTQTLALGDWAVLAEAYDTRGALTATGRTAVTVSPAGAAVSILMGSANAKLADLMVRDGTTPVPLIPGFDPDIPNYTVAVSPAPVLEINAVTQDADAVPTLNNAAAIFPPGVEAIIVPVVVNAQDGVSTMVYTITATRILPVENPVNPLIPVNPGDPLQDAGLKSLEVNNKLVLFSLPLSLNPSFDPNITSYTVTVIVTASSDADIEIIAVPSGTGATLTIDGVPVMPGTPKTIGGISIGGGVRNIPIVVTAGDGLSTKTYTIKASPIL
jgi:hypothetical protein